MLRHSHHTDLDLDQDLKWASTLIRPKLLYLLFITTPICIRQIIKGHLPHIQLSNNNSNTTNQG